MPWANDGGSSLNAAKCVPVAPNPDLPGDVCTAEDGGLSGVDTCDLGAVCLGVDGETGEGRCVSQCVGSDDDWQCPEPGFSCQIVSSGVENFCFPNCNPVLQGCGEGLSCQTSLQGDFVCLELYAGGGGIYGDHCSYSDECNPGFVCLYDRGDPNCIGGHCCTPFCDINKANTCPGGTQECIPWYEEGMAPPGYEDVGICGVPQ